MFVYEDDSVCLQSQSPRDVCPQSLHSLPAGDSEFHRATGCGDDGQTHSGLTGGDLGPAGCRPTRENAAEPRRLVHSSDQVRFWALRLLLAGFVGRCNTQPVRETTSTLPTGRPAHLNTRPITDGLMSRRRLPTNHSARFHTWFHVTHHR